MPAVDASSNARVLVTGANGFLAMWIVHVLLKEGFTVRGTVRTEDKGTKLKQFFSSYGNKFDWFVVKDITTQGAFDEAVKDVDAIVHTASPVSTNSDDPEGDFFRLPEESTSAESRTAYIRPAVDGTLCILNSVLKFGTKVKRVVMTSSLGALLPIITGPVVLDENSWGDLIVKLVEEQGKAAPPVTKYWASKTLSERAAWDFYEKHKAESCWELVVINPSIPPLQEFETSAEAPLSVQLWYDHIAKEQDEEGINGTFIYADVRDVAEAHLRSITREAAGGERIVVSAGNIIFALKPEYYSSGILPRGKPDVQGVPIIVVNTTKAQDILGIKYRSLEETIESTLAAYEAKGLITKH
ncbi:hypothetical protein CVT25_003035 [Psilocybe cyanescens]|uniref:NAD-dependent epimerase/dehydratase domain-containing protein n=1 Tax=Psilocybe cyanescens TaxID=93625 RepID=A0A409XK78_PSICY|nr:hypothetical protein CVT25_003035 [Psilocybe cyanescens]